MTRYNISFRGETLRGHSLPEVKRRFANAFRIDNPQRLEAFFKGYEVVLRRNLDKAEAERIRDGLRELGIQTYLQEVTKPTGRDAPTQKPAARSVAPNSAEKASPRTAVAEPARPVKPARSTPTSAAEAPMQAPTRHRAAAAPARPAQQRAVTPATSASEPAPKARKVQSGNQAAKATGKPPARKVGSDPGADTATRAQGSSAIKAGCQAGASGNHYCRNIRYRDIRRRNISRQTASNTPACRQHSISTRRVIHREGTPPTALRHKAFPPTNRPLPRPRTRQPTRRFLRRLQSPSNPHRHPTREPVPGDLMWRTPHRHAGVANRARRTCSTYGSQNRPMAMAHR